MLRAIKKLRHKIRQAPLHTSSREVSPICHASPIIKVAWAEFTLLALNWYIMMNTKTTTLWGI